VEPPPSPDKKSATAVDYILACSVVGVGLLSAFMSLVLRAHGI
jgi:hypothetical protein